LKLAQSDAEALISIGTFIRETSDLVPRLFGGYEGMQSRDFLLAKLRIDFPLASKNVLESFIKDKKNTKGLTSEGKRGLEIL